MSSFALAVYALCALTSLSCAGLLARGYRRSGARLLLWSALCFAGLALNNIMLIVDVRVLPDRDLSLVRTLPALIGVALLVYGLVWDARR
ncbi:MAG TPA: DUF5985 family protein [Gemmatimonadaceae bacterium]|jgi:hypothetical protein